MRKLIWIAPAFLLLGGCSLFAGHNETAVKVLGEMLENGTITQAQYDTLVAAFQGGGLREVLGDLADGAIGIALGYLGIKNVPKLFGKKAANATPAKPPAAAGSVPGA